MHLKIFQKIFREKAERTEGCIDKFTIGGINAALSKTDRTTRLKISKDILRIYQPIWSNWHLQNTPPNKGFPGGSDSKVSACNAGDSGSIPGSGRSAGEGNGNSLQYSCLENLTDGAWLATVHGVAKSQTRLSDFTSPPNNSRIHILSKCIQNTNQGISYSGPIYKTFLSIHIIQSKFSDHSESKLEMNCRKICGKIPKYLETGDTLLSSTLNRARINSKTRKHFGLKVLYIVYYLDYT